jgi:spermidine synthase
MTSIYTLTIFTSAFLLFLIQPMISKLLLPHLGGSPAVWNTSMMFFQVLLLLGYAYAHLSGKWLGTKKQVWLHLVLLGISLLWLPIAASTDLGFQSVEHPITWMLISLFFSVGFPFFVLAANAPLLQLWLSRTNHKDAQNPYFLYSASNVGSLIALLGYPFIVEPLLALDQQTLYWSFAFVGFILLIVVCSHMMKNNLAAPVVSAQVTSEKIPSPTNRNRIYWTLLAFFPSSLLLGVTTYITTDIASMPLFWVIPLAVYLLTFIMAFAKKPLLTERTFGAQVIIVPFVVMALAFGIHYISQVMILHLFALFYIALGCHGLLAQNKPHTRHLTEFYLWVSFGGMLGGVFNSLVAPVIFDSPIEYPMILLLSLLMRPWGATDASRKKRELILDLMIPINFAFFLLLAFFAYSKLVTDAPETLASVNAWLTSLLSEEDAKMFAVSIVPLLVVGMFVIYLSLSALSRNRPLRFALITASLLIVVQYTGYGSSGRAMPNVVYQERNFFGINRVLKSTESNAMMIMHGTTLHGMQSLDPEIRLKPVSYYWLLKEVLAQVEVSRKNAPVAVLGLGAGTTACIGKKGQLFDFYEIDPAVAYIAQNPEYFTYLKDCGPKISVIMGDGRLSLAKANEAYYGLIIIDVFSSDAIPVHLLTREALLIYKNKLAENGIMAFNVSNRHLNLYPVMAALAKDIGVKAMYIDNMSPQGKLQTPSKWVIMAREDADFSQIKKTNPEWKELTTEKPFDVWTDHYSNILQVIF